MIRARERLEKEKGGERPASVATRKGRKRDEHAAHIKQAGGAVIRKKNGHVVSSTTCARSNGIALTLAFSLSSITLLYLQRAIFFVLGHNQRPPSTTPTMIMYRLTTLVNRALPICRPIKEEISPYPNSLPLHLPSLLLPGPASSANAHTYVLAVG